MKRLLYKLKHRLQHLFKRVIPSPLPFRSQAGRGGEIPAQNGLLGVPRSDTPGHLTSTPSPLPFRSALRRMINLFILRHFESAFRRMRNLLPKPLRHSLHTSLVLSVAEGYFILHTQAKRLRSRRQKLAFASLLFLIIAIPVAIFIARLPDPAAAGWWDEGWAYRKKVTINNSLTAQTDYVYGFSLESIAEGSLQADCGDIRITDSNAVPITDPFWVDCTVSTSPTIWIKFSSLATGNTILYVYYGSLSAQSIMADPDNIFIWAYDFAGATIDTAKITQGGGLSTQNEYLTLINNADAWDTYAYAASSQTRAADLSFQGKFKAQDNARTMIGWHDNGSGASYTDLVHAIYFNDLVLDAYEDGADRAGSGSYSADTWYDFKIVLKSTGATLYTKAVTTNTWTSVYDSAYSSETPLKPGLSHLDANESAYTDNWLVRQQLSTEPTVTVASQESTPGPVAYWKFDEGHGVDTYYPIQKHEQQINILNQYYTYFGDDVFYTAENSFGLVHWDADKYSDATVYLEVDYYHPGWTATISLYEEDGDLVSGGTITRSSTAGWYRDRTSALTLVDGTNYTVKFKQSYNTFHIKSARLIVVQSSTDKITATETQIEIGAAQYGTSNTATQLTNKKIYYYDSTKFNPAPTAYFEASLRVDPPTIEQQLEITNQNYTYFGDDVLYPADNSFGLINWDADKYAGATVYFEADFYRPGWDTTIGLYEEDGDAVAGGTLTPTGSGWMRQRTSALTLVDGTNYTVKFKQSYNTFNIKAARLVIVQSDSTKITDTQTQIEIGATQYGTSNTATQLTNKKIYYYDSTKFNPAPTAYFEASLRVDQPTIEQHMSLLNQIVTIPPDDTQYPATANAFGLTKWDSTKYSGATVYFEADIYSPGWTTTIGLYEEDGDAVSGGTFTISTGGGWQRRRSSALTLVDGTNYTVRGQQSAAQNAYIRSAKFIIIQTDATKITDTETTIDLGTNQTAFTNTSAAELTDPKIYQYNASAFTPTVESSGDATFSATLKIDSAGDTAYAELYNKTNSQIVATVSHTGDTNWTYVTATNIDADSDWDTTNDDDYVVRVYCADGDTGGCSGNISNAKIILTQHGGGGITALETTQQHVIAPLTDADATYTSQNTFTHFNYGLSPTQNSFGAAQVNFFYESTIKTSAGTGYAQLYNTTDSSAISNSAVTTTSTSYERQRSSDITTSMPLFPQYNTKTLDTQIKNSATNTTTVSGSWIVVQISNLSTTGAVTAYADLYNLTTTTPVANSEVSSSSTSWDLTRSSSLTLTTGNEYVVRIKSSVDTIPVYITNAKIILDQSDAGGITALETMRHQILYPATDADATYTSQNTLTYFNHGLFPTNNSFGSAKIDYFYEATMKTSAGTGYAQLYNSTDASAISSSEITTTNTSYERQRSSNIFANLPMYPQKNTKNLDTQLKNSATNTTTASSSWVVLQISNLSTAGTETAYADLYNLTTTTPVANSEVSSNAASWTLVRSNALSLNTANEYVVRVKSSIDGAPVYIANAKLILDQSDSNTGILAVESPQGQIIYPNTDTDTTYTSAYYYNYFDPSTITPVGTLTAFFESTFKTSAGTGYAQLYNVTGTAAVSGSEITTTDTNYDRVRSGDITDALPVTAANLDTQLKNSATNTTTASNSWLIVQNDRFTQSATHDSTLNLNHASIQGPMWKSGSDCITGFCFLLDGTNDYLQAFDNPTLDVTTSDSLTLSGWFKHSGSASGTQMLVAKHNGTAGGYKLYMNSTGKIVFAIDDDSTWGPEDTATSIERYDDNTWHHVSAIKNGTSSISLYLDGVKVASDDSLTATGTLENTNSFYMGIDGDGSSNPWSGYLDEIKVYAYARSADEIKVDYTRGALTFGGGNQSLTDGLVLHYKFDETSANTCDATNDACDSSGNLNHARWEGNATNTTGKYGQSIDLDGTGDQVATTSANNVPINDLTRHKLTFNNAASSENLTDFPVLITLNSSRVNYSLIQNSGQDIRFYDSDGTTLLDHEIESWNESGTSYVWVRVPNIPSGSTSDFIWLEYGDTAADSQNPSGVWDSNYAGVWHLKETSGTDIADSTGNAINGTKSSASTPAASSAGKVNGALSYDGTNNIVSIPDNAAFDLGNVMTIEAWINPPSCSGRQTLLGRSNEASVVQLEFNNASCAVGTIINGVYISYTGTSALTAGQWNHVVYTRSGAGATHAIYVNGVSKSLSTNATNSYANPTGAFELGRRASSSQLLASGTIVDEFRISNIARSADWNEAQHLSMADTFITYGPDIPSDSNSIKTPLSLSFFVNPDTIDSSQRVLVSRGSSPAFDWAVALSATNSGRLWYTADGEANKGISNRSLSTSSWSHVALVADGVNTKLFINGEFDSQFSNSGALPATGNISVGSAYNGTQGFDGKIDDFRIYNRALGAQEISQLAGVGNNSAAPGPVLYYDFNENTGTTSVYDKSGNNYTGTMTGSMTESDWVVGKFGSALKFNGTSQYVSAGSILGYEYNNAFTLSAWIKRASFTTRDVIMGRKESTGDTRGYYLTIEDNDVINWNLTSTATIRANIESTQTITDSEWHHIAATHDGTGTAAGMKIYIDGVQAATTTVYDNLASNTIQNAVNFEIASRGGGSNFFDGIIDDAKVYNYARTPAQIVEDMNAGHPAPGSPVGSALAHWKFDEGALNTCPSGINDFCDSGPLANDLAFSTTTGGFTNSGKFGKAFNGTGSVQASRADDPDFDFGTSTDFTISAWVFIPTGSDGRNIISKGDDAGGGDGTWGFDHHATNNLNFFISPADATWCTVKSNNALTKDTWHHVVAVTKRNASCTTNDIVLYDNGQRMATSVVLSSANSNANLDNDDPLYIGYKNGSSYFTGYIDELKIYNFALTADQVKTEYNQGSASVWGATSTDSSGNASWSSTNEYCPPDQSSACTPPVAEWKLDENTDQSANDSSGYGNSGTLTNSPVWTSGKFGSALNFDETSSMYVNIADSTSLNFNAMSATTISAWAKLDTVNGNFRAIYSHWNGNAANRTIQVRAADTNFWSCRTNNGEGDATGSDSITAGVWYHIACVWTSGNSLKLYVNGELKSTDLTVGATLFDNTNIHSIGARYQTAADYLYDGTIDNVVVYNYARTPAQIAWEYNRGAPIVHYKFDKCSGATAYNSALNAQGAAAGNNGTVTEPGTGSNDAGVGSCSVSANTMRYGGVTGKYGASLEFDGTDDYVTVADANTFDFGTATDFSTSLWVKISDKGSDQVFIHDGEETSGSGDGSWYVNYLDASSAVGVIFTADTYNYYCSFRGTTDIEDGTWHHLTAIFKRNASCSTNDINLYIDGKKENLINIAASSSSYFNVNISNNDPITIGAYKNTTAGSGYSSYTNGLIDEIKIWNYALTQKQVELEFNQGKAVNFSN